MKKEETDTTESKTKLRPASMPVDLPDDHPSRRFYEAREARRVARTREEK